MRCDEDWIEERIREGLLKFRGWPPMGVGRAVPEGYFERFSGVLPESALYIWRRFGFDGFGEGRSWITDPLEWAPVVGAWLEGVELPFPDRQWYCITRTALGRMTLWGEVSGPALKVDVIDGVISPDSRAAEDAGDPVIRERMGCTRFTSPAEDVQVDDVSGLPLADGAIGRLGVLGAGQVYGFEPPWRGDRAWRSDLLEVREAVPYLVDLARGGARRCSTTPAAPAAPAAPPTPVVRVAGAGPRPPPHRPPPAAHPAGPRTRATSSTALEPRDGTKPRSGAEPPIAPPPTRNTTNTDRRLRSHRAPLKSWNPLAPTTDVPARIQQTTTATFVLYVFKTTL